MGDEKAVCSSVAAQTARMDVDRILIDLDNWLGRYKRSYPNILFLHFILHHFRHPTLRDRLSTAGISNISRYRSDCRHRRNATLAIMAFASADLYRKWQLVMLPRRQKEN